jgi:hypothetical protein
MPNRHDLSLEPTHWLVPYLEDQIRVHASTIRFSYAWCLGMFLLGVVATVVLFRYAVGTGTDALRLGPFFISTAVNGVQYAYMSPGRQRLSGLNQVKLLLEKPDLQAATKEELEKIVLGALKAVIGSTS